MNKFASPTDASRLIPLFVLLLIAVLALFAVSRPLAAAGSAFDCADALPTTDLDDCKALVALYDSAGGPGWTKSDNWLSGSPCSTESPWYGVTCSGSDVTTIDLSTNGLNGVLPPALINLANLQLLILSDNQIAGQMPELTNSQSKLFGVYLNNNRFSGSIPPGFGSASALQFLYLNGNVLRDAVPSDLCDLSFINQGSGNVNLRYNALEIDATISDVCLDAIDPEWRSYQTVPPDPRLADLHTTAEGGALTVSWDPIPFTAGSGFYEVFIGEVSQSYDLTRRTQSKSDSSVTFENVPPNTKYYIAVRTQTNADLENNTNPNIVVSDLSDEVTSNPTAIAISAFEAGGSNPSLASALAAVVLLAALSTAFLLRQWRGRAIR